MKNKQTICAIVAIGPDNVIGRDGVMPWHSVRDLYHFKNMTMSHPCIFGRNTFEHLPVKPLPGRFNLVVGSHYKNEYVGDVFFASSIERAISECSGAGRIFICGGAAVYQYALNHNLIDIMYLTIIKNSILEHDIRNNPGAYCRFPVGAKTFFNGEKWNAKPIIYQKNVLPTDVPPNKVLFYECTRVR